MVSFGKENNFIAGLSLSEVLGRGALPESSLHSALLLEDHYSMVPVTDDRFAVQLQKH
jgi:hypothetical protein